ncbi:phosphatase PAP2 family protein [Sphingopyxis indica]|uniref:phosphatase PAP2 family protein n=1 Tax=Sphingopyxis indica TaxID=436663 RepID=UPI002938D086|nr:phosphatase PAP2 family protein [Sphingopyxis indica]WOF45138.1 phosphatase PAP2 family protein [Sphingopyxis indica]
MSVRASLFFAALCLAATLLLGLAAPAMQPLDEWISRGLSLRSDTSSSLLIAVMQGISWLGGGVARWAIVVLLCALLWRGLGRTTALRLFAAALTANLASTFLKNLYDRPRPALVPHLDHVSSWSYPSGHAASVAAVAIALTLLFPPRWRRGAAAGAALAILLTDLSRVTLGVHWASDVVGGTLLGAAAALAIAGPRRSGGKQGSVRTAVDSR